MCVSGVAACVVLLLSLTAGGRAAESGDAVWRNTGESITIQCTSKAKHNHLLVRKCCNTNLIIFQWNLGDSQTVKHEWKNRLKAQRPNTYDTNAMAVTISNLTAEDTGVFLCEYQTLSGVLTTETRGAGSVVLVVHDAVLDKPCYQSSIVPWMVALLSMVLVLVLLLVCIFGIFIARKMQSHPTRRPCPANPSEVYEDMRSTRR